MKEEIDGPERDTMLSQTGGFKTTKAVHILRDALRYYKDNAGLEQSTFLFLDEFLEKAMVPYLFIYMQGMKRGKEITEAETFLTREEYQGLMGTYEEEEKEDDT